MALSQQNGLHLSPSSLLPPQPPSYQQSQGQVYEPLSDYHTGSIHQLPNNQSSPSNHECNGNESMIIYGTYNQDHIPATIQLNNGTETSTQRLHQSPSKINGLMNNGRINSVQDNSTTYYKTNNINTSQKSSPTTNTFYNNKQPTIIRRSSPISLNSSSSNPLMPINVKSMLLHGVDNNEVIRSWLISIKCEDYLTNFVENGYDMPLLTRMTPQDLTAIGCKSPAVRKKLLTEIRKLNLEDDIPSTRPESLEQWLELLKLKEYYQRLCDEGYDTVDKVCGLTWEDLEEIGITKLGHQKRLLLGTERIKKLEKLEEERSNDHAIYDVHPNHRVSLNPSLPDRLNSTLARSTVRSGFFQTRSGANLDYRGLPVATVMPALKHVTNALGNLDFSHQPIVSDSTKMNAQAPNCHNNPLPSDKSNPPTDNVSNSEHMLRMIDLSTTIKRNPPPLPPVRTNSLKSPQDGGNQSCENSIYRNSYKATSNANGNLNPMTIGSTSFLRTPKLGTLTATTNKMLTSGGHIQTINGQTSGALRTIMPIREAPLPPIPTITGQSIICKRIDENPSSQANNFPNGGQLESSALINSPLIGHQLASADEFPPPPPSQ